jgi:hypothetical protein
VHGRAYRQGGRKRRQQQILLFFYTHVLRAVKEITMLCNSAINIWEGDDINMARKAREESGERRKIDKT